MVVHLSENNIEFFNIGTANDSGKINIKNNEDTFTFNVSEMRDVWYKTSYLLDNKQTANGLAKNRFDNYKNQPLQYTFPKHFTGKLADVIQSGSEESPTSKAKIATSQTPRNDSPIVTPQPKPNRPWQLMVLLVYTSKFCFRHS